MADDWQPGDLAMLVRAGTICCDECKLTIDGGFNPPRGAVREVIQIETCGDYGGEECSQPVLILADGTAGHHSRFRKIRPLTDKERDEFLADIKTPEPVQ